MKKIATLLIVLSLLCGAALAETVSVTITDGTGAFGLAMADIDVTDIDGDGALTIYDALYCAHEAGFEGGAEAGFAAEDQGYGLSLSKLWGEENGGSYGYCVNNASAMSLSDPISEGDHIQAYVYQDLETWSDQFSYFTLGDSNAENALTLTLYALGYDEEWNPVEAPVAGAKITMDGEDTGLVTDENGQATIVDVPAGAHLISASHADMVLVPPVFKISAAE